METYARIGRGNDKHQTLQAMIFGMDRGIGRVLDTLESTDIADNTLVWFFSDNGGVGSFKFANFPLRGAKGSQWEGGCRVAACVRWPDGFKGGRKVATMMGYIDVLPTLLSIADCPVKPKKPLDGRDMSAILAGRADDVPDRPFFLGPNAVATQEWKLSHGGLYNMTDDPCEQTDLSSKFPERKAALRAQLDSYMKFHKSLPPNLHPIDWHPPKNWKLEEME